MSEREDLHLLGMEYMELLKDALAELGGSAKRKDVIAKVRELVGDALVESERTLEVKVSWARQYLIEGGIMDGSEYGVWKLADGGQDIKIDDEFRQKVIEIENTKEKTPKTSKKGRSKSTEDILRWCQPIVEALRKLGGAAKPDEVKKQIIEDVNPDEEYLKLTRGKSNINLFQNEVDFARGYLAQAGIIDKEIRGVWTLTDKAKNLVFDEETIEMIYRSWKTNPKKPKNEVANVMDDGVRKEKYWLYSPAVSSISWEELLRDGVVDMGWNALDDLSQYENTDEIRGKLQEVTGSDETFNAEAIELWLYANEMKSGDVVFVKEGKNTILGKGIVETDYVYDETGDTGRHLHNVDSQ